MTKTCQVCLIQTESMKRCSRCEVACYCSVECQKVDWIEHKLVCSSSEYGSTADNYRKQGYFKKAEKLLLKEDLVVEEGENSILIEINAKITLACDQMSQNKFVSANSLLKACLSSLREYDIQGVNGATYLMTAVLCNLGACFNSQNMFEDSIIYLEEARALNKFVACHTLPDERTKFLVNNFYVSTYNLCIALEQTGRHEDALKMLTAVINDMKVEYGDKSPELIRPMFILSGFYQKRRNKDFKRINKEAVQLAKEVLGSNHLEYLQYIVTSSQLTKYSMYQSYEGEGMDFGLFDEWDEAKAVLRETLKKLTKRLGKKHSLTIDCKLELARVLIEKRHFKKAEKYLLECIHYWKTAAAENDCKNEIRKATKFLRYLDREWYTLKIQTHALQMLSQGLKPVETVNETNYGDDRVRTYDGFVIDDNDLFTFERDINEDDGYILMNKSLATFSGAENILGGATIDEEVEEADKCDDIREDDQKE